MSFNFKGTTLYMKEYRPALILLGWKVAEPLPLEEPEMYVCPQSHVQHNLC